MLSPLFGETSGLFSVFFWFWCLERLLGHAFRKRLEVQDCSIAGLRGSELREHNILMTCCPGELLELSKASSYQCDDGTRLSRECGVLVSACAASRKRRDWGAAQICKHND